MPMLNEDLGDRLSNRLGSGRGGRICPTANLCELEKVRSNQRKGCHSSMWTREKVCCCETNSPNGHQTLSVSRDHQVMMRWVHAAGLFLRLIVRERSFSRSFFRLVTSHQLGLRAHTQSCRHEHIVLYKPRRPIWQRA